MVITCDTPLSEILDSGPIVDVCNTINSQANGLISSRTAVLTTGMQSGGGLDSGQTVDGQPIVYDKGQQILQKYARTSETISRVMKNAAQAAVDKEIDELGILSTKVKEKIEQLNIEIDEKASALAAAEEAAEASLNQGSQFAMVSPQANAAILQEELNALIESRRVYKEKYDAIGPRLKKLDPDVAFPELSIPELSSGGETESGEGEKPEEETPTEETPTDSNETPQPSGYEIPTEGRTPEQMYSDARDLQEAVQFEQEYLMDAEVSVRYDLAVLEQQYQDGAISEETYTQLKGQYETVLSNIDAAVEERTYLLEGDKNASGLRVATQDNFGSRDGWLKDSQETTFGTQNEVGNLERTAARVETDINERAAQLTPIDQIIADNGLIGITPLRASEYQSNQYCQGIVDSGKVADFSSIPNTTRAAAYEVAQNNGTATEISPGVYVYSVGDYYSSYPSTALPPTMSMYSYSGYEAATMGYYGEGEVCSNGDTVYNANTGEYCSWAEYASGNSGFSGS